MKPTKIYSLIVPIYCSELNIDSLLPVVSDLNQQLGDQLEVVFVVDGSPDRSYEILQEALPKQTFTACLVELSRNFGSYPAIKKGLEVASGQYFAVMAADLQEPPELIKNFFDTLEKEDFDVAVGARESRQDKASDKLMSKIFWKFYKKIVIKDLPAGGVDVFAFNRLVRDTLLGIKETNTSLIGLLFWVGFRRKNIYYDRLERQHGKSSWSLKKKIRYMMDSIFSFSDLPIYLMSFIGGAGVVLSLLLGILILLSWLVGWISQPGYTPIMLTVMFFSSLILLSIGIISNYIWRAYENTKGRPEAIIRTSETFNSDR